MIDMIVKMKFGSHLYGTATENSDIDYKGIYLPSRKDIYLNRIHKCIQQNTKTSYSSKNTKDDIDYEIYSIHYFLKLALEGQMVPIDMIHAPENMLEFKTDVWSMLVKNKEKLYTKNLAPFLSYLRQQAAKYSCKGSRLNSIEIIIEELSQYSHDLKLKDILPDLSEPPHTKKYFDEKTKLIIFEVCGKKFQETIKLKYLDECLKKFYKEYGARAIQAKENKGIEWKSISHAFRAAFQVKQILTENTVVFPLKEAPLLLDIKLGKLDFVSEITPMLNDIIAEVQELSDKSNLPEEPDKEFWDNLLYEIVEGYSK